MDHCTVVRELNERAKKKLPKREAFNVRRDLSVAYQCKGDTAVYPIRFSTYARDTRLFKALCKHAGTAGTATKTLPHKLRSKDHPECVFHGEIYLCEPASVLRYVGEATCAFTFDGLNNCVVKRT